MNTIRYPENTYPKTKLLTEQTTYSDYYFIKQNNTASEDVVLIGGGVEHCKPDYAVCREHFIYHSIEYIASGSCVLRQGKKEYKLSAGSVFAYGPSISYDIESSGDDGLIKYFINFTGDGVLGSLSTFFLHDGIPVTLPNMKWIGDTFLQLQECGSSENLRSQNLCLHLLRYLVSRIECSEVRSAQPISPSYVTYQSCRSYIESRFLEIRSISEVAEACNISICHVSRLFKKYSDISPCALLTSLKLNRARELLKDTDLLIKQVAEAIGIDDQYYFSNRFKQHFGISPLHYKRTICAVDSSAA